MTPEDIQAMAKGLAEGHALWYLLSAIIGGAITGLGAYLAEKGKNRATREDIGAITRQVENAREEFNSRLEDLKAHHQLRLIAAEKRLHAHQDAYTKCIQIYDAVWMGDKDGLVNAVQQLEIWYPKNCVFLSPKSRQAIRDHARAAYIQGGLLTRGLSTEELVNAHTHMQDAVNVILSEVELPSINLERDIKEGSFSPTKVG